MRTLYSQLCGKPLQPPCWPDVPHPVPRAKSRGDRHFILGHNFLPAYLHRALVCFRVGFSGEKGIGLPSDMAKPVHSYERDSRPPAPWPEKTEQMKEPPRPLP